MIHTILITDDEVIAAESVAQMVKRNFRKAVSVEICLSGKHAIERAAQIFPDVVIMDIKMFGINGLEAIRSIKEMNIGAEFIILSAFDYFDYAQEAISLGVSEYLLKPVDEDKLCAALSRLMNKHTELTQERLHHLNQQERLMMSVPILETSFCNALSLPGEHSTELIKIMELTGYPATGGSVILFQPVTELKTEQESSLFDSVRHHLKRAVNCIVGRRKSRFVAFIVMKSMNNEQRMVMERAVESIIKLSRREGIALAVGVGRYYSETGCAQKSYFEARCALKYLQSMHENKEDIYTAAWFEDLADVIQQNVVNRENPGTLEKYISSCLEQADPDAAIRALDQHISRLFEDGTGFEKIKKIISDIVFRLDRRFSFPVEDSLGTLDEIIHASSLDDLSETLHDSLVRNAAFLDKLIPKKTNGIIEKAEAYINEHYMEPVTLEQVALAVNLSQHYFSRFFKQEKGINFTDYLTNIRIEHAKLLFSQGILSIKEIAYQTGFQDPNYFSKKFKQVTGISPSRFMND